MEGRLDAGDGFDDVAAGPRGRRRSELSEFGGELLAFAREDPRIQADGRECRSPLDVTTRRGLVRREDARGLAARLDALDRVVDRGLHFRVPLLSQVPESRREI